MDFSEKTPFPKDPFFRTRKTYRKQQRPTVSKKDLAVSKKDLPIVFHKAQLTETLCPRRRPVRDTQQNWLSFDSPQSPPKKAKSGNLNLFSLCTMPFFHCKIQGKKKGKKGKMRRKRFRLPDFALKGAGKKGAARKLSKSFENFLTFFDMGSYANGVGRI